MKDVKYQNKSESELGIIQKLSEEIFGLVDMQEICEKMLQRLVSDLEYSVAGVALLDEENRVTMIASKISTTCTEATKKFFEIDLKNNTIHIDDEENYCAKANKENKIYCSGKVSDMLATLAANTTCDAMQDACELKTCIAVPIRSNGKVLGSLYVISKDKMEKVANKSELNILQILANDFGNALNYARVNEKSEAKVRNHLMAFQRVTSEISGITNVDELIRQVLFKIADIARIKMPTIFLYDEEQNGLRVTDTNNDRRAVRFVEKRMHINIGKILFPLGKRENYITKAFIEKKIYHSVDFGDFARGVILPSIGRVFQSIIKAKSGAAIPLIVNNRSVGVLTVGLEEKTFSEFDKRIYQTFANQVAFAIENAQLYENLQKTIVELRNVNEIQMQFLADTSHELKTPIAAIQGNAEVITYIDPKLGKENSEELKLIKESANRMKKVVSQLLTLTRNDTGHLELMKNEINLKKLIAQEIKNLQVLANEKQINISVDIKDNIAFALDEDRFAEVIQNLLSNAIKYTPNMGTIHVQASKDEQGLQVSIKDSGVGIPKKDIPFIFDRFYKVDKLRDRKMGGTGLGLAICKSIVEAHGGKIWVESEMGKGTEFKVALIGTKSKN